jgi:hypothetical protein
MGWNIQEKTEKKKTKGTISQQGLLECYSLEKL